MSLQGVTARGGWRAACALVWAGALSSPACSDESGGAGAGGDTAAPVTSAGTSAPGQPPPGDSGNGTGADAPDGQPTSLSMGNRATPKAAATGTDPSAGTPPTAGTDEQSTDMPAEPSDPSAGAWVDAGTPGDGAMEPPAPAGPLLPAIDDPGDSGPFEIQVVETLEGLPTHILIAPQDLGRDGIKHPIIVWINGAGANSSSYRAMHDNLAAHGFFLLDDKQSTFEAIPEISSQRAAIDWAVEQAQDPNGPYYGKIDESRIAIGGHSLGSVASFGNVADPRLTTSLHMAGGVIGNPGGVDNSLIEELRVPTIFLCGTADRGMTRVRDDFAAAPSDVPLFFGMLDGVGHLDEFNQENGGRWGRIVAAWMRWRLADDESAGALFAGDNCEFCAGDWAAMKHALD